MSRDSSLHSLPLPTDTKMEIAPPHSSQTPSATVFLSVLLLKANVRTDFSLSAPPINILGFSQWQRNVFPFFKSYKIQKKFFKSIQINPQRLTVLSFWHASFHEYSVNYNQMHSCLLHFRIYDVYLNSHSYLFLLLLLVNKTMIKTITQ